MASPETPTHSANKDIPTLSVAAIATEYKDILDRYNRFIDSQMVALGKPKEVVEEPPPSEQARGELLWKELLRRAVAGNAEAKQAIIEIDVDDELKEPDGSLSKETLQRLLDSSDTLADG